MKSKRALLIASLGIVVIAALLYQFRSVKFPPDTAPPPPIVTVGWQRVWATQGQVMKTLDKTNISSLYGVNLVLRDFQYGPDLNEAALTDEIQVTNAGIVPVISLLAKNDDWVVVARHIDFLVAIVARPNSGVQTVQDLRGKRFGIPIGGGTHPYALSRLQDNGLSTGEGPDQVRVLNLQPTDQPAAMKQNEVDAVAVWEPTISVLVKNGGIIIDRDSYCGFITVRKTFAEKNREAVVRMLEAYIEAFLYTAQHRKQTDLWFSEASGLDLQLISNVQAVESSLGARQLADIDLSIDQGRMAKTQQVADTMYRLNLITRPVHVQDRTDLSFYRDAVRELRDHKGKTLQVHAK